MFDSIFTIHILVRPKKKSLQLKYFLRFNSDFPSQLRGIINEEEFQQSINEINEAFLRKQLTPKDYWYIYFLAGVVGLVLALVSIRLSSKGKIKSFHLNFDNHYFSKSTSRCFIYIVQILVKLENIVEIQIGKFYRFQRFIYLQQCLLLDLLL